MEENKSMQIEVRPEVANGVYSNLDIISHSRTEFVIDFASVLPGAQKPGVVSRVLMSPEHCKRLLRALMDNINKYESQFGTIDIGGEAKGTFNLADFNPGGTRS